MNKNLNVLTQIEHDTIVKYLTNNFYNISKTARELKINRMTLYSKMKKLNIHVDKSL